MHVKKAVFPLAGLATNFLPATKANPKEMMPIVDIPLIQYAAHEATAAGITELIFITNSGKRSIEDHFDANYELEANLIKRGEYKLLDLVRNILPQDVDCVYTRQNSPRGLGDAILCAKNLVGNEPFAILLADDLIDGGNKSCLQQMIEVFEEKQSTIVATQKISRNDTAKYAMVDIVPGDGRVNAIQSIIEKPAPSRASSNLAVVGRYIMTPEIFSILETTQHDPGVEIQLTDAIAKLLQQQSVYSFQFEGDRYDCGTKLGYLNGTVAYALKHPDLSQEFRNLLNKMLSKV